MPLIVESCSKCCTHIVRSFVRSLESHPQESSQNDLPINLLECDQSICDFFPTFLFLACATSGVELDHDGKNCEGWIEGGNQVKNKETLLLQL